MPKISESQLKRAMAAARVFPEPGLLPRSSLSKDAKLVSSQRAVEQLFMNVLAEGGLNKKEFSEIKERHQTELRRASAKNEADAVRHSADARKAIHQRVVEKIKAVPHLPPGYAPIILDKPFLIWAQPSNIIYDTHIEPGHSWAKIKIASTKPCKSEKYNGSVPVPDKLSFYYLWENPSDYYAVIDASTYMALIGYCRAVADGAGFWGIFDPTASYANLFIGLSFRLWEWWKQPVASYLSKDLGYVFSLQTDGNILGDTRQANIINGYNIDYSLMLVPPHSIVVFEILFYAIYDVSRGHIHINFADGDFEVLCPYVLITLRTAPLVTTSATTP